VIEPAPKVEAKKPTLKPEVKKVEAKPAKKVTKEPPKLQVELENIVNTKREKHAPAKFTPSPSNVAAYHS
jgi:hypothetical protein